MTLTTLVAAVQNRAGVPTTDALWTTAAVTQLLNAALHAFETEADWRWMEASATITTVNATRDYAVPSSPVWRRTLCLIDPNGFELPQVNARDINRMVGTTGYPRMYDVYAGNVRLAPTPVTSSLPVITHLFVRTETDLAAGSDVPLVPDVWQPAIVEYAAYLGFRRWGKLDEAGGAKSVYDEWVKRAIDGGNAYADDQGGGEMPRPAVAPTAAA